MQSQQQKWAELDLQFGHDITAKAPTDINIKLTALSQKAQNNRFNITNFVGYQVPKQSIVFELTAQKDGEEVAQQIKKVCKKSESIKKIQQDKGINIKTVHKNNNVYLILTGYVIQSNLQKLDEIIVEEESVQKQCDLLFLHLQSINSLQQIRNIVENKDILVGIFDSLRININFIKSDGLVKIIQNFMTILPGSQEKLTSLIAKSFQKFCLKMKFQSSQVIQTLYPIISQAFRKVKICNQFKDLQKALTPQAKIYGFGNKVSFNASVHGQNMYLLLDLLFA